MFSLRNKVTWLHCKMKDIYRVCCRQSSGLKWVLNTKPLEVTASRVAYDGRPTFAWRRRRAILPRFATTSSCDREPCRITRIELFGANSRKYILKTKKHINIETFYSYLFASQDFPKKSILGEIDFNQKDG